MVEYAYNPSMGWGYWGRKLTSLKWTWAIQQDCQRREQRKGRGKEGNMEGKKRRKERSQFWCSRCTRELLLVRAKRSGIPFPPVTKPNSYFAATLSCIRILVPLHSIAAASDVYIWDKGKRRCQQTYLPWDYDRKWYRWRPSPKKTTGLFLKSHQQNPNKSSKCLMCWLYGEVLGHQQAAVVPAPDTVCKTEPTWGRKRSSQWNGLPFPCLFLLACTGSWVLSSLRCLSLQLASWLSITLERSTGCGLPGELVHCNQAELSLISQCQDSKRGLLLTQCRKTQRRAVGEKG